MKTRGDIAPWWAVWAGFALLGVIPGATIFAGSAHQSQAAWLVLALAPVLAGVATGNPGAVCLGALAAGWGLIANLGADYGLLPPERAGLVFGTLQALTAGLVLLALLPRIFRGRGGALLLCLRLIVLICCAWWAADCLGWQLLSPNPEYPMPPRLRGGCLGSSVLLGGLLGASWPLFLARGWRWSLVTVGAAMIGQESTTGWLAAAAAGGAWLWLAGNRRAGREPGVRFFWPRRSLARVFVFNFALVLALAGAGGLLLWLHEGPGGGERLEIWRRVIEGARFLGCGPGAGMRGISQGAYALALWEFGWLGLGFGLCGLIWVLARAASRPELFAALAGLSVAMAGTLVIEQAVTAAWLVGLLALVEVSRGRG